MATFRVFGVSVRRIASALVALAWCAGGIVTMPKESRGESIQASDFKIDIASNMAWVDSGNKNPAMGLKLWRQTAMEQTVLASRPYVRVTNMSAGGTIENFQLNLWNRDSTQVNAVTWDPNQSSSRWKWMDETRTARFDFNKPIESGESFTLRLATGPRSGQEQLYSLQQNFFTPGQPIFGEQRASGMSGFGILGITVFDPTRASRSLLRSSAVAQFAADPVDGVDHFTYNLDKVVVDPYKAYGQQVGITITAVPEPSGLVLLGAAIGVGGVVGASRRRRGAATA